MNKMSWWFLIKHNVSCRRHLYCYGLKKNIIQEVMIIVSEMFVSLRIVTFSMNPGF